MAKNIIINLFIVPSIKIAINAEMIIYASRKPAIVDIKSEAFMGLIFLVNPNSLKVSNMAKMKATEINKNFKMLIYMP